MRAAFFESIDTVKFVDVDEPVICDPKDVKVRIAYTGICGSEILGLQGAHPTRKPPIISGHEASGIVVEVGEKVTRFSVGDRVVIEPQYGCEDCETCKEGNYNVCPDKKVLGTTGWQGSFGEYIVAPERTLLQLPESVSLEYGALLEPLSVGFHAVRISKAAIGKSALILGSGPIGMAIAMACKCAGLKTIICTDIKSYNLDLVQKCAATHTINSNETLVPAEVEKITCGRGVDIVYIAVGTDKIMDQALDCVKRKGQVVLLAHFKGAMHMDAKKLRWKEASMLGTFMFVRNDFEIVLDMIDKGTINPGMMLTQIVPIEKCVETFNLFQKKNNNIVKMLMSFTECDEKNKYCSI